MQEHHTETALPNTATYRKGQFVIEQLLVEEELLTLILSLNLQLSQQTLLIDTDTHRRELKRTTQHRIPDKDITIKSLLAVLGYR